MDVLEREDLLRRLHERLATVRRGSGHLVLLAGEAGVGKTALVGTFLASLPRGTGTMVGGCDPIVPPRAFAPIGDMATAGVGGLADVLRSRDRDRVFVAFLAATRRLGRGGVVVLEDLHWADAPTLDLLLVVGRRLAELPVLVVGTYRPHDLEAQRGLRIALGDIPPERIEELEVPPLSAAAVARLARGRGLDPDALHRATGGNAFFVTEVLASRTGTIPATVHDAIAARVARLADGGRRTVNAAAVLGPRVERAALVSVTGQPSPANGLDECIARGILEAHGEEITFRHDLAREAILDNLPAGDRTSLHQRALATLRSGIVAADPVRLARHAIEAGDAAAVIELVPPAAERSSGLGAHAAAADLLAIALALPDHLDDRRRGELLDQFASECALADRAAAARAAQEAAVSIWRQLGDRRRLGSGLRALAMYMWQAGEGDRAREFAHEAVRTLEAVEPPPRELAEAWARLAQLLTNSGQDDATARRWAIRAVELAERLGAEQVAVHARTTLGVLEIYHDGDVETGWAHLAEALVRARAADLGEDVLRILINLVESARDLHRYDVAEGYAAEALALLAEREAEFYRHLLESRVAQLALTRGRWDEAERLAQSILRRAGTSSQARVRALEVVGRLRARRGQPAAWAALDEALGIVGKGELQDLCPLHAARAEVALLEGDEERAGREAMAGFVLAARMDPPGWRSELSFLAWRTGRIDRLPDGTDEPWALRAAGRLRESAAAWRALGCPYDAAAALADSGDEPDLREALVLLHGLGGRALAGQVASRLEAMGARSIPRGPRPSTSANPAGLSRREMEVLALIREGARNAEIADRLVLSTKTVDHHVSAILRKLGVRDRAAARREAERLATEDGEPSRAI